MTAAIQTVADTRLLLIVFPQPEKRLICRSAQLPVAVRFKQAHLDLLFATGASGIVDEAVRRRQKDDDHPAAAAEQ